MVLHRGFSRVWTLALFLLAAGMSAAVAQTAAPRTDALNVSPPPAASTKAPDSLSVYFDLGSAAVRPSDEAILDQASRLYREGKPILMVVTGATDAVGAADANLRLSQTRANTVLRELVARGIPVERFQVVGKGQTDPAVPAQKDTPEPRNRRVEITWR